MEKANDYAWIVEADEVETRLRTVDEVKIVLTQLEQAERGHVFVLQDYGPLPWWRRWRGKRDVVPCFSLEWEGEYASLTFLDDVWSEYTAIDANQPTYPSDEIRMRLSRGEPTPAPAEECMETARAFAAVRIFLDQGVRPDWLSYRYVK